MVDIVVGPEQFAGVPEASIVTWIFKDGTPVKAGEVVCEVMVEKSQFDVASPVDGILRVKVAEEEVFTPGTVIGVVEE